MQLYQYTLLYTWFYKYVWKTVPFCHGNMQ